MACYYVSVTEPNINSIKLLKEALEKMGHKFEINQIGNSAVFSARDFRIEMNTKGAQIDRADGNKTWINQLKQRYAAEAAKSVARKKGYYVKETLVGDKIELTMRK